MMAQLRVLLSTFSRTSSRLIESDLSSRAKWPQIIYWLVIQAESRLQNPKDLPDSSWTKCARVLPASSH